MLRGQILEFRPPRGGRGHEQRGKRFGLVVQSELLNALSTVVIAPTSRSAPESLLYPTVTLRGRTTRILVPQLMAVDPSRLGREVGRLTASETADVDAALRLVLGLV